MKRVLIIAITAALAAAAADATDFVNEKFEGSFPPPGWTTKYEGTASGYWTQREGGPWGKYAQGIVSSYEQGYVRITLMSPEFNVKANTKVYYFFHHRFEWYGHSTVETDFYIAYVPPHSGNLIDFGLGVDGEWGSSTGWKVFGLSGRVKAYWRVWVTNYWRQAGGALSLDNVVISDEDPSAVSPASLGRVKALFR